MEQDTLELKTTESDFLNEFENILQPASQGKRFLNLIIDLLVFYILIFVISVCLAFIAPNVLDGLDYGDNLGYKLLDKVLSSLLFGLYIGAIEGLFKGKSIGKFLTKTKAVNEDGSQISWATAFKRGLSRAVPFEQLSALSGTPWHDTWTNTLVINDNK